MTHVYFSAHAEGIRTFRHALGAAYRTAISAAQILVFRVFVICEFYNLFVL